MYIYVYASCRCPTGDIITTRGDREQGSTERGWCCVARCLSNYMSINFFNRGRAGAGRATYCNNTLYFDGLANFVVARVT